MTQHILLVMVTGLLAVKYDEPNERFLRYLWILACIIWVINVISDVIKMIGQNARFIGERRNMNKVIRDIIDRNCTNEDKKGALDSLINDINIAKGILSGKFTYCPKCDDYYLTKSYLTEHETKPTRICVYEDPINSGGNDYVDGEAYITYKVCPKGHKLEIDREERKK